MQALSQLSYGPTTVVRASVSGVARFGSALLILCLPRDQAGKLKDFRLTRSLAFLPGTMCDERVWAPVRQCLKSHFSSTYIAIETRPDREAMVDLIESAAVADGPLHLVALRGDNLDEKRIASLTDVPEPRLRCLT